MLLMSEIERKIFPILMDLSQKHYYYCSAVVVVVVVLVADMIRYDNDGIWVREDAIELLYEEMMIE